ncbi:thiol:disulfide interchange protein TlpA [Ancylobacter amanitiformis]|uniref:Thiol-disulfide isomerase/thioredoxin n=1 Tax=Ancylobacter amanitiformis TaxID=217069 RepID=A0ABU0LRM4_9HYPH|nr:TlpA disulfide reductase family protein [Ancylobacter amanitiformis]MDQ0511305.1 thiol-disulfide isomerase/thioredoxin [Ancylobacter amanitiformis]
MTERPEDATPPEGRGTARAKGRFALIVAAALVLGAAAGLAGVYGIGGGGRNAVAQHEAPAAPEEATIAARGGDAACTAASDTGRRIADLAKGELAAFAPTLKPTRIPDLAFLAPDGTPSSLSKVGGDGLKLVNIWATWCVPCRKEMPALDELQGTLGATTATGKDATALPGFAVIAINIDQRNPEKPKTFMDETGIRHLALYTDPKAQAFQDLRAVGRGFGLPTTMLIDAQGCEIGHIAGPAEWASPDAVALIEAARRAPAGL